MIPADSCNQSAAHPPPHVAGAVGRTVAVIGAGPAGLMAAETLAAAGHQVAVFDAMPSAGRKFLLAGKGGLNLTHGEPLAAFVARYAARAPSLQAVLQDFGPQALRDWVQGLGIDTFVGSSGRVFPRDMKSAPLLRAWLHRLRGQGVQLHQRHRWTGFSAQGAPCFDTPSGQHFAACDATVLALGGASWPQLGSNGAWVPVLQRQGVDVAPLQPSNCGFDVAWSAHLQQRFAGEPLKGVAIRIGAPAGAPAGVPGGVAGGVAGGALDGVRNDVTDGVWQQAGEFVLTAGGVEGSLIYAASPLLRDAIAAKGSATFVLDLLPQRTPEWVARQLAHPRGPRSLSTHLKTRLGLAGAKAALLWELVPKEAQADAGQLARWIKALPITVLAARPVAEAISTAGGVRFEALDDNVMLRQLPGVFIAGEMLDWEAPTGGYLLTACFATGRAAGLGAARWLAATAGAAAAMTAAMTVATTTATTAASAAASTQP